MCVRTLQEVGLLPKLLTASAGPVDVTATLTPVLAAMLALQAFADLGLANFGTGARWRIKQTDGLITSCALD